MNNSRIHYQIINYKEIDVCSFSPSHTGVRVTYKHIQGTKATSLGALIIIIIIHLSVWGPISSFAVGVGTKINLCIWHLQLYVFPNTSLLLVVGHNSFQIFDHLVLWWRVIKNIVDEMLCYMYARSQETGSKRWELHIINKRSMKWWCKRWKVENHYWFIFFYLFFSFNSFCENSFISFKDAEFFVDCFSHIQKLC